MSLARVLSKFGVCSRRQAEHWIAEGRVAVDGRVERDPRRRLSPGAVQVTVDGRPVAEAERLVLAFHKPAGLITTRTDPGGRATIYDCLAGVGRWVFPVGRLDRDSSGLLILTSDHVLGNRLSDPAFHVPKTYHARVAGVPDGEALRALAEGVPLADGPTRPARVRVLGAPRGGGTWIEVVLTEGRNRQLRRMCAAVGHHVLDLVRVAIGELSLGDLAPGAWRHLGREEVTLLLADPRRGPRGTLAPRRS